MLRFLFVLLLVAKATGATNEALPYLGLARLDRDQDRRVSETEFLAAGAREVAQRFSGIDTDRSGFLSASEIESARLASEERLRRLADDDPERGEYASMPGFPDMDLNRDGRLDAREFAQAQEKSLRQRFQLLDADADGFLSASEFERARSRFLQQVGRPPDVGDP